MCKQKRVCFSWPRLATQGQCQVGLRSSCAGHFPCHSSDLVSGWGEAGRQGGVLWSFISQAV